MRTSRVLATLSAIGLVFAASALAATLVGTERAETIRGTPGPDRISGRGGADTLIGGRGRDVVDGGRGDDRLLLRDGARDLARCGPGRDTVLADAADVVLADCETLRVFPPEPQAPPPRPVVAGLYGGRTTQGELVTFRVTSGGELSALELPAIHLACGPGGEQRVWSQDFGATTTVIGRDGSFAMTESGARLSAAYRITVSGLLTVGIATGAVEIDVDVAGTVCAAPGLRWTAAAAALTGP